MTFTTVLSQDLELTQLAPSPYGASQALYLIGVDVTLAQADVPYVPPTSGIAQSTTDFLVYADTVTITEDLMNPGATIAIFARQINVAPTTILDVSGGAPTPVYLPGLPAKQTDLSSGAAGAAGHDGPAGSNGGKILLSADVFEVSGTYSGSTANRQMSLARALERAIVAATPSYMATPNLNAVPVSLPAEAGYSPNEATLNGLSFIVPATEFDPSTSALTATFTTAMTLDALAGLFNLDRLTFTFDLAVTLTFAIDASLSVSGTPTVAITLSNASVSSNSSTAQAAFAAVLPGYLDDPVTSAVEPMFTALANALAGTILPSATGTSLLLLAAGGEGGRGEDGAPGVEGSIGKAGENSDDEVPPTDPPPSKCVGGSGGPGGTGGDAGQSGAGGAGGTVSVVAATTAAANVAVVCNGGPGGIAAFAGAGGPGGPGGPGGTYYVGTLSNSSKTTAPSGSTGSTGAAASFQGAPGIAGANGTSTVGSTTYDDIAPLLLQGQLQFQLQAAKINYLNAEATTDYTLVLQMLNWLYNVTLICTQQQTVGNLTATDIAARAALNQCAVVELGRLSSGLDYFGDALNWVPVLTLSFYEDRVSQLLDIGNTVVAEITDYESQENSASIQTTISTLQNDLTNISNAAAALQQQITAADQVVTSLTSQIAAQQELILSTITSDEGSSAVQATGCPTVSTILSGAASIIGFVGSAAAGVGTIAEAVKLVQSAVSTSGSVSNIVNTIQTTPPALTFSSLQSAYNAIVSQLQSDPNSALVGVDQDAFNSLVEQYFTANAAATLEEQVQTLITLAQTRNQALLNATSLYGQMARQNADEKRKQTQLENAAALLAEQNPALPDLVAFLQAALQNTLNDLVDNLWQENQAYSYWSLDPQPFVLEGLDVGSLSQTSENLSDFIESYLQQTARPFAPFQGESITISATDYPSAFALLPQTQQLTFAIDLGAGPFAGYYQITAATVAVSLPTIPPPSGDVLLNLTLVQCGPDVLEAPDGTIYTFTHQPRPIPFQYNYSTQQITVTGAIGDPSQDFTGLSPFATWTIDFSQSSWLDLTQVTSVMLTLSGYLLGQSSEVKASPVRRRMRPSSAQAFA